MKRFRIGKAVIPDLIRIHEHGNLSLEAQTGSLLSRKTEFMDPDFRRDDA
jgi:hypothetical protein